MSEQTSPLSEEQHSCDEEGCDHPPGYHKWEIEPSPYAGFDVYVSDDDESAINALHTLCDNKFADLTPGDDVTIKIRMNKP